MSKRRPPIETADSIYYGRPAYTCDTCRKWVFYDRRRAKYWLKERSDQARRPAPHSCGEGFVVVTR